MSQQQWGGNLNWGQSTSYNPGGALSVRPAVRGGARTRIQPGDGGYGNGDDGQAFRGVKGKKWAADVIMAHEYGHLLQGRTGIFVVGHLESQNAPSKDEGLEYLRRLETQADCFSAAFLRSVSRSLGIQQADIDGILESYAAVGDETLSHDPNVVGDHGLARSRRYWSNLRLGTSAVGTCNTFRADDKLVL